MVGPIIYANDPGCSTLVLIYYRIFFGQAIVEIMGAQALPLAFATLTLLGVGGLLVARRRVVGGVDFSE
jgi:hypothetical protein